MQGYGTKVPGKAMLRNGGAGELAGRNYPGLTHLLTPLACVHWILLYMFSRILEKRKGWVRPAGEAHIRRKKRAERKGNV